MNISPEGVAITNRFFEAIDMLKSQKQIRGLQTITTQYNINRSNLVRVRNNPESSILKPEHIAILVKDFGVPAEWLLTGGGGMLAK